MIEIVEFPQSFADLVDKVQPAVVNISTTTTVRVPGNPFQHFFGQNPHDPDRELKQRSLGNGFIIDKSGLIVTNNHLVERADEIKVKLSDSREFKAAVIGRKRAGIKSGDIIVTFAGRSIKEVSDLTRIVAETPIDRDVVINLFREGKGVNVNVRLEEFSEEKISRHSAPNPDELGLELVALDANWRRKLGVRDLTGLVVVAVAAEGPAAAAGIERGDIIKEVNRRTVKTPDDFYAALNQRERGKSLLLLIKGSGNAVYLLL